MRLGEASTTPSSVWGWSGVVSLPGPPRSPPERPWPLVEARCPCARLLQAPSRHLGPAASPRRPCRLVPPARYMSLSPSFRPHQRSPRCPSACACIACAFPGAGRGGAIFGGGALLRHHGRLGDQVRDGEERAEADEGRGALPSDLRRDGVLLAGEEGEKRIEKRRRSGGSPSRLRGGGTGAPARARPTDWRSRNPKSTAPVADPASLQPPPLAPNSPRPTSTTRTSGRYTFAVP